MERERRGRGVRVLVGEAHLWCIVRLQTHAGRQASCPGCHTAAARAAPAAAAGSCPRGSWCTCSPRPTPPLSSSPLLIPSLLLSEALFLSPPPPPPPPPSHPKQVRQRLGSGVLSSLSSRYRGVYISSSLGCKTSLCQPGLQLLFLKNIQKSMQRSAPQFPPVSGDKRGGGGGVLLTPACSCPCAQGTPARSIAAPPPPLEQTVRSPVPLTCPKIKGGGDTSLILVIKRCVPWVGETRLFVFFNY